MAETVSDKEVQGSRKRVDSLREQLAKEQHKSVALVNDGENAIRKAQLDAEAQRLEAELAAYKDANKASVIREQQKDVIEQVTNPAPTQTPAPSQNEEK